VGVITKSDAPNGVVVVVVGGVVLEKGGLKTV